MSVRGIAVGVLTLLAPALVTAGPLPISWSIRSPTNTVAMPDGVSGGFSFPNTVFEPGGWDGDVVVTPVTSYSLAKASAPDRVSDLPYQFAVELRDDASGETALLTFGGELSGTLWRTGNDLDNRFTGPTSRVTELGGQTYQIELTGFTAPTGYGDAAAGEITARVSVLSPSETPVVETPEPGTLALGCVAAGMGGAAIVRRVGRRGRVEPGAPAQAAIR